jgi:hypothetical protein
MRSVQPWEVEGNVGRPEVGQGEDTAQRPRAGPEALDTLQGPGKQTREKASSALLNSGSWPALLKAGMTSWLLDPKRFLYYRPHPALKMEPESQAQWYMSVIPVPGR